MQSLKNLSFALESVPLFTKLPQPDTEKHRHRKVQTAANDIGGTAPHHTKPQVICTNTGIQYTKRPDQRNDPSQMPHTGRIVRKQIKRTVFRRTAQVDPAHERADMFRSRFLQKTEILLTLGMRRQIVKELQPYLIRTGRTFLKVITAETDGNERKSFCGTFGQPFFFLVKFPCPKPFFDRVSRVIPPFVR